MNNTEVLTTPIGKVLYCALDKAVPYIPQGSTEPQGEPKFKIEIAFDEGDNQFKAFEHSLITDGLSLKKKISKKTNQAVTTLTLASTAKPLVFDENGLLDELPRLWANIDEITAKAQFTVHKTKTGRSYTRLEAVELVSVKERQTNRDKDEVQAEVRQEILKNYMAARNKNQQEKTATAHK